MGGEKNKKQNNISLINGQLVEIIYLPESTSDHKREYNGTYIKCEKNIHSIAVCVMKGDSFNHNMSSIFDIVFSELNIVFHFSAELISIKPVDLTKNIEVLKVVDVEYGYDVYMIEVVGLGSIEECQRREYFRIKANVPIFYKTINHSDEALLKNMNQILKNGISDKKGEESDKIKIEEELGYKKWVTSDISAGGFMMKCEEKLISDTLLDCIIMADTELLPVIAKVVNSDRVDHITGKYEVRNVFVNISEPVRNNLMKYIFRHHRRMVRKVNNPKD